MEKTNKQIAEEALALLTKEGKTLSAKRLESAMKNNCIMLGIDDIDWDIQMALENFGGVVRTNYRGYFAKFYFN